MSRFGALQPGALAMLLVGAIVLFVADSEALRVASAALLLAGIGLGVFAIATPQFLGGDERDDVHV